MKPPLTAPAVPDAAAPGETAPFDVVDSWRRRPRWARIAAWSLVAVAVLVALATAGLRLLVLPWGLAFPLGLVLGCALALLAAGIALIALAVRG
ncbi:MAG TPA: hypothetical protein VLB47_14420 [Solirubrobacteraceae bacterium]|nr:hypothetical protein [Solirubrobacteraceae bacterium]